ncbi:MAG: PQQ-dependent sugar dehydrogenase [Pseudomonadota bacterium]
MRAFAVVLSAALFALPAAAQSVISTDAGNVRVESFATGLEHPWGVDVLPDGALIVTERPGRVRIVEPDGSVGPPLKGVPDVAANNQGGMLDVKLDPAFSENRLVWLSYAEPGPGGASTALGRGRLSGDAIEDFEVVYSQTPKVGGGRHFGGRIVFAPNGDIYLSTGDRGRKSPSQDLSNSIGAVVRLTADGVPAPDNFGQSVGGAAPEIFSYGHRNALGAVWHPERNALWIHEMGPRHGDELHEVVAGENYGWPLVSWGDNYSGIPIPDPDTRPDLRDSATYWVPSIAPSGMAYYGGDAFPEWQGSLLIGGLGARGIVRVETDQQSAQEVERIDLGARIRDVEVYRDGSVLALIDAPGGGILRLSPSD